LQRKAKAPFIGRLFFGTAVVQVGSFNFLKDADGRERAETGTGGLEGKEGAQGELSG